MDATQAAEIQRRLAAEVSKVNAVPERVRYVAGVDTSAGDAEGAITGAVIVLEYPSMRTAEVRTHRARPLMPYVPGFLSFREAPAVAGALEALSITPDVLLVDGQGLAHPRRLGIACHLGLLTDIPTIGVAKSVLVGKFNEPAEDAGAWTEMTHRGEVVGAAVRTRGRVTPVYLSIGHKVDLESAVRWTLGCCRGYRLPEPTRLAHQAAAGRIPVTP